MAEVRIVRPPADPSKGVELRTLRNQLGLHRGDVAKLFGWSSARILEMEDGRCGPETDEGWRAIFKAVREAGMRGR